MAIPPIDVLHGQDISRKPALRVLLVEDSPLQQKMIELVLIELGHSVSVVNDGFYAQMAVSQDGRFDAVLMDCQLPVMDGFQATRLIREQENVSGERIAIIGVSATASAEDCLAAGMDDFLAKPISKPSLKAVLARWTKEKVHNIKRVKKLRTN